MFPFRVEMDSIKFIFQGILNDNDNPWPGRRGQAMTRRHLQAKNTQPGPRPEVNASSQSPLLYVASTSSLGKMRKLGLRQPVERGSVGFLPGLERGDSLRCS